MCYNHFSRPVFFLLIIALLGSFLSLNAHAQGTINAGLSVPASSSTGNYTVTWNAAITYTLQEKFGNGSWVDVYTGPLGTKSFSGKSGGIYTYRIKFVFCYYSCTTLYSDEQSINVQTVPAPSIPGSISGPNESDIASQYTLTWAASNGSVTSYQLQEKIGEEAWTTIQSSMSRNRTISNSVAGVYEYRVRACSGSSCSAYTGVKSVNVVWVFDVGLTLPNSSSTGDYVASWTGGPLVYSLQESFNGGAWSTVYTGTNSSHQFVSKPIGEYRYRIEWQFCFYGCNYLYTPEEAISVTGSSVSQKSNGFDGSYKAYIGDYNSDGINDYYVRQDPSITSTAEVAAFVLIKGNQNFTINGGISGFDFSSWPESEVTLIAGDINIDGTKDLIIKNIAGELDQIIYASPEVGLTPTKSVNVDNDLLQFFQDAYMSTLNPDYFEENAPIISLLTTKFRGASKHYSYFQEVLAQCNAETGGNCTFTYNNLLSWLPINAGRGCEENVSEIHLQYGSTFDSLSEAVDWFCTPSWYGYIVYVDDATTGKDFSVFNDKAITFRNVIRPAYSFGEAGLINGESVDAVELMIEEALNEEISFDTSIFFEHPIPDSIPTNFPTPEIPTELPPLDGKPKTPPLRTIILQRVLVILGSIFHSPNAGDEDEEQELALLIYGENLGYRQAHEHEVVMNENPRAVIGEETARVEREALALGAAHIGDVWPEEIATSRNSPEPLTTSAKLVNMGWINGIMAANFTIFDIGRSTNYSSRAVSPFYQLERRHIAAFDYPLYQQYPTSDTLNFQYED